MVFVMSFLCVGQHLLFDIVGVSPAKRKKGIEKNTSKQPAGTVHAAIQFI